MKIINKTNFEQEIIKSNKLILVDFYAPWCKPCSSLQAILEEVQNDITDSELIVQINVDDNPELATTYGLRGIPTMLFFKNGKIVKSFIGIQNKDEILKAFKNLN